MLPFSHFIYESQTVLQVFLKYVQDRVAASILEKHVQCMERLEVDCSAEEDCRWDKDTLICEAKPSFVMRTIAGAPLRENDIDCQVLRPMLSSGCVVKLETECTETPGCYWEPRNGNRVLIMFLALSIFSVSLQVCFATSRKCSWIVCNDCELHLTHDFQRIFTE